MELPLEDPDRWKVETIYKRRTKEQRKRNVAPVVKGYELQFDGKRMDWADADNKGGELRLRDLAKFYNHRRTIPAATSPASITSETPDLFA